MLGFDVIAVVTPVDILSIGLKSELEVVIVNELVVASVLGFYNPSIIIVNGVSIDVKADEKAFGIYNFIFGEVADITQDTYFSPPIFTLQLEKLVTPVGN